ncbi:MAG: type II toxin-antitoxin system VapC family toxin [Acidobacteria bacterium]|nr:type II toxin-antitoxin system VapC family toxin [Acidobacteriota bacterium]
MRIAVDTNRYRDFCAGLPEAVEQLARAEKVFMPFVTLAELRAGFLCGNLSRKNESVLVRFLGRPRVGLLYPDEDTTHHYARIFAQLRSQGTPIPTNDIWIAALVAQHDLLLYSRDRHFDLLPQLPLIR